jgi:hypothetical protein
MCRQAEENPIDRIRRMEFYFDTIQYAFQTAPRSVIQDPTLREMLQKLTEYYESGLWLADYTQDEQGELPAELKRGILSEDGFWNLLCDIRQL